MGQYFFVVNQDKKQYLNPHRYGDGLKLVEFGMSAEGTLYALTLLLRQSSAGGGGDYHGHNPIVGSWAGDRITIVGDYDESRLFQEAEETYEEMSAKIWPAMLEDSYFREEMARRLAAQRQEYGEVLFFSQETLAIIEGVIGEREQESRREQKRLEYNRKRREARAAAKAAV